jgi:hypothetical protein
LHAALKKEWDQIAALLFTWEKESSLKGQQMPPTNDPLELVHATENLLHAWRKTVRKTAFGACQTSCKV